MLGCAGGAALLSACAAANPFATAPVDPGSPVAQEVAKLARNNPDYPSFNEIPALPKDVRPAREWGRAADQLELAGAALERETAPGTWTLQATERFAAQAMTDVGPAASADTSSTAATEAFARQLRERATPPPSPR